jgi:hypothetical protein
VSRRVASSLSILLLSATAMVSTSSADPLVTLDSGAMIAISINDDLLSVQAQDRSPVAVLESIGLEAGITTVFVGDFSGQSGSWSLVDVPLAAGIRELVGGNSMAVISGDNAAGISKLTVYAATGRPSPDSDPIQPAPLESPPGDPGPVEANADDISERIVAIESLAGLDDQEIVDRLGGVLNSDPEVAVRKRAAIALEDIGGDPALQQLEAGLGDGSPDVRIAIVESLGRIGGDRAIMALGQTIMGDSDPLVRQAAVLALQNHESGAVQAFRKAASADNSALVREASQLQTNP